VHKSFQRAGKMNKILSVSLLLFFGQIVSPLFARSFPDSLLPSYIKAVVDSGERPDWSFDGTRLLFLNHSGGDVFEVEVATKKIRPVTSLFPHRGIGYWRALYLPNGDFFLTAGGDRNNAYAYIIDSSLASAPVKINKRIREGPAISRTKMHLAYTPDMSKIYEVDLVYTNGVPDFANEKLLIENGKIALKGNQVDCPDGIEPQNWRPPEETELTCSAYGYNGTDAFLFNLSTGRSYNITDEPCYDEPEGIFPDGQYTLVECTRHDCGNSNAVDCYRYGLTDPSKWDRMTYFADVDNFKASNPVVRDDGKYFSFMESRMNAEAGVGYGIYVYDLVAAGYYNPPVTARIAPASRSTIPVKVWAKQLNIGRQQARGTEKYDLTGRVVDKKAIADKTKRATQAHISPR